MKEIAYADVVEALTALGLEDIEDIQRVEIVAPDQVFVTRMARVGGEHRTDDFGRVCRTTEAIPVRAIEIASQRP